MQCTECERQFDERVVTHYAITQAIPPSELNTMPVCSAECMCKLAEVLRDGERNVQITLSVPSNQLAAFKTIAGQRSWNVLSSDEPDEPQHVAIPQAPQPLPPPPMLT